MPTYEYRCKECGHEFEAVQSFSEDSLTECPQCAGALRKVFGNVGITFKGSGFYKTDSRGGSSASGSSSANGSKSESKSESTSEPKSDSKSETKGGTKSDSGTKAGATTT